MVTANTSATLSALHKEIYGDTWEDLIPDGVKLIKKVSFKAGDKELGDKFVQPVQLAHEAGFSYGSGVFTLNDAIPAQYQEAQVSGQSLLLRTAISYGAAARMSNSKKSFVKWSELIVGAMINSTSKRLEIQSFYGNSPAGIGRQTGATVSAGSNEIVTFLTAEWSPGIWAGSEGTEIDAFDTTGATQRNTIQALKVVKVDLDARSVEFSGAVADLAALVTTDIYFFRGAKGNEGNGLDKIITNTGSLYNIDAGTFNLWKGTVFSAGSAALTFAKVNKAIAGAVERGLEEMVCVMVPAKTWTNLQSDEAALRRYTGGGESRYVKKGPESIEFYGQNGVIEIVPSIYVKEGETFLFPPKRCMRLGSTDVTFKLPGKSEEELYLQLPSQAGYELRCYTEQNFFSETPARLVKIDDIVNT